MNNCGVPQAARILISGRDRKIGVRLHPRGRIWSWQTLKGLHSSFFILRYSFKNFKALWKPFHSALDFFI